MIPVVAKVSAFSIHVCAWPKLLELELVSYPDPTTRRIEWGLCTRLRLYHFSPQGLNRRQQTEGYGVPSGPPPPNAPLFQDTSGVPSFPPMSGPQQLLANPVVTATAIHYGTELASRGQSYVDQNVGAQYAIGVWFILGFLSTFSMHTPNANMAID